MVPYRQFNLPSSHPKSSLGQVSDFDESADQKQAACYENINGLVIFTSQPSDKLHGVLDRG